MKLSRLFSRLAVLTLVTAFVFALTGCGGSQTADMTIANNTNHIMTGLYITPSGQTPSTNIVGSTGFPAHRSTSMTTAKQLPYDSYDIVIVDDTGAIYHFDHLPAAYLEAGSSVTMVTSVDGILNLAVILNGDTVTMTVVPTSCTLPQSAAPAVTEAVVDTAA